MIKILTFSGHRNLDTNKIDSIRDRVKIKIQEAYTNGYKHFMVGGALGFDMIVLEELIKYKKEHITRDVKFTVEVAIPFKNHNEKWSIHDIIKFENLLDYTNKITYTSNSYDETCYSIRNKYMVDRSDKLIVYWKPNTYGGTFNAMKHGEDKGIFIENIY